MRSTTETAAAAPHGLAPPRKKLTPVQRMATFEAKVALPNDGLPAGTADEIEMVGLAHHVRPLALAAGMTPPTYGQLKAMSYNGWFGTRREKGRLFVSLSEVVTALGLTK